MWKDGSLVIPVQLKKVDFWFTLALEIENHSSTAEVYARCQTELFIFNGDAAKAIGMHLQSKSPPPPPKKKASPSFYLKMLF